MSGQIIKLSDSAAARIKEIMSNADGKTIGVRVGVKTGGCAGMSYSMEYAKDKNANDVVEINCNVFDEFYKEGFKSTQKYEMFIVETANERLARAKKQREKELEFSEYLLDEIEKIWWNNFINKQ